MTRISVRRIVAALIAVLATLSAGILVAQAATGPSAAAKAKKMTFACASKSSGGLRYVTKASGCKSTETGVDFRSQFVQTCVKQHGHRREAARYRRLPAGSTRLVTDQSLCAPRTQPNERGQTLPAPARTWFCALRSNGRLRAVNRKPKCFKKEHAVYLDGRTPIPGGGGFIPGPTGPGQQANRAPVAVDDSASTDEHTARTLSVLGNDTDADSDALRVASIDTTATKGTATANADGTIGYDPNGKFESLRPGESATDTFRYTAGDPDGASSNSATVTVTITGLNDAPTGVGDAATTDENAAKSFSLTANDTDADGDSISIGSLDLAGTKGRVTPHSDGTVTYDPDGKFEDLGVNETGQDVFKYKASDGTADSAPTNVVVTVAGVNDAPVVATTNSTLGYTENGGPVPVDPGATVSDVDGDAIHGATIQITANHRAGEDVLAFSNANGISGSYDAATGKLTLTGDASLADYQAALRSVTYANASKNPSTATRTVAFRVTDVNLADSAPATRDISVASVDDAPVVTTTGGSTSYTENGTAVTVDGSLDVTDVDSNIQTAEVKVAAGFQVDDKLDYTGSYTHSYDAATGVLTLQHADTPPADFRDELRKVTFASSVDDPPGSKTISFKVSDGQKDSAAATKAIAITAVNDAPVNTVPGAQGVDEDTDLAITGISFSDPDAGTAQVKADVSVAHGTLRRSSGGTPAASLSFTGTQAEVNAALSELVYKGSADYNGSDALTIVSDDQGHTGTGGAKTDTDTVAITVNAQNDGPVNHVPGAQTTDEDTSLFFTGAKAITVSDVDSDPDDVKVDLTVGHGKLTLGSLANLTVTGNGTNHVTLQGTQARVNAGLDNTEYAPGADYNGGDTLTVKTDDLGHNGAGGAIDATNTVGITVTSVNDGPKLGVPGAKTIDEDTSLTLGGSDAITITDVDAGDGTMRLILAVSHGKLHLASTAGLSFESGTANDSSSINVQGSRAALNSALDGLTYTPNADYAGSDSLIATVEDNGNSGQGSFNENDTRSVAITVTPVNDAPVVSTSSGSTPYTENGGSTAIDGALTVSDADDDHLEGATVAIGSGRQTGDSLDFTNTGAITGSYNASTGVLTLTGHETVAGYQAALRSVKFSSTNDDPSATKSIGFTVSDGDADSSTAQKTIAVTAVNDAPVVALSSGQASYTEGDSTGVAVDPGATVSDADDATLDHADVRIVSGYIQGADQLTFTAQNGITSSFDAGTGDLTLYGPASKADLQTAIRSIRFTTTSKNPGASRQIAFRVTDPHSTNSAVPVRGLSITQVNDAPVVTTTSGNSSYTEGGSPATVDGGLTVADPDSANLSSAQVEISSGTVKTGDSLSFTATGNINGSYNAATHILSLTGTDTQANYQTVLRSVKFSNSTSNPSSVTRRIAFRVSDGSLTSTDATKDVTVTEVNSAPAVTTSVGTTSFTENSSPVVIDPSVSVTDADSSTLSGATVRIAANRGADDSLTFTNTANITGSYSNGTLTLSGTDTVANYETALRSVKFANGSDAPGTGTRAITFQVDDGQSANHASNQATKGVSVTEVNDKPVVTPSGAATSTFVEDGSPVTVDGGITVSDVDSMTLSSVSVTISSNFTSGDVLAVTPANGITGTYNASSGTLTLSGAATPGQYSSVLQSVTFSSTSQNPGTAPRTLSYVADDGSGFNNLSTAVTRQVNVVPVNDAPVLTQPDGALTYTEDSPSENHADAIAPNLTLSDVDDTSITGATVSLSSVLSGDALAFTNQNGITGSYNSGTGVMTLSGSASLANYQAALRSVKYLTTSDNPSAATRTVTFRASDGHGTNNLSNAVTRDINVVPTNDAPSAANFTFDGAKRAVGNTSLVVDDPTDPAPDPTGPQKTVSGDLLAGVSDPDSPAANLTVNSGTFTTSAGGSIIIESDGDFTYLPPSGCTTATDSVTYQVSDNDPSASRSGQGTLSFAISDCVWYVDANASAPPAATAGESQTPLNSLTGLNGAGGSGDKDGVNDTIFLYPGTYTGGLPLETGQRLLTKRAGLTVPDGGTGTVTLESAAAGTDQLNGGLVLASGNNVQGLDLGDTTTGAALSASGNVGTVHVDDSTSGAINNTAGGAVDVNGGGTLNMAFSRVSSTGGAYGIRLGNTTGTFTASGGLLQNATTTDVDLNGDNSGDNVGFTYAGAITDASGTAVSVANQNGGTKTFSGNVNAAGTAVSLSTNTGATMNFSGGLTAARFAATGGGTVSVTDPNGAGTTPDNVLDGRSSTALNVADTTIGDSDLNFTSISATNANPGINLSNTSNSNGRLAVIGTSSGVSGGIVTGSSGNNITLANVPGGVSLSRMGITGAQDDGVHGSGVNGFSIDNSTVGSNGDGTYATGDGDRAFDFTDLTGTSAFTNDVVPSNRTDGLVIRNTTGNSSTTVTGGNWNGTIQNDAIREVVSASSGTHSLDVEDGTFSGNNGDQVQMNNDSSSSTAVANLTVNRITGSSTVVPTGTASPVAGGGITGATSGGGVLNATITNNAITGSNASAVNLTAHGGSDTINGKVTGNTIGSTSADGIQVDSAGATGTPHLNTLITNNTITGSPQGQPNGFNTAGIEFFQSGSTVMNGTLKGNVIRDPRTIALNGIRAQAGMTGSTDSGTLCLDMGDPSTASLKNDATGGGVNSGQADIRLIQRGNTTINLPGYAGGSSDTTAVGSFVAARNLGSAGASYNAAPGFTGTGSGCNHP